MTRDARSSDQQTMCLHMSMKKYWINELLFVCNYWVQFGYFNQHIFIFQSEVTINDNVNKFPIIVPGIDSVQSKQLTITIVYEGVIEVSNFVMKACVPKQGQGTSN